MNKRWFYAGVALAWTWVADPALAAGNAWLEAGRAAVREARAQQPVPGPARNVILFLGDGMGITTVTAARILEGQQRGESGEENALAWESFPYTAFSKTYSVDAQTAESAGTMTAIVTGAKTTSAVLSVDETVQRGDFKAALQHGLVTILEQAEQRGLATGVVTTTTVTHATPGATYAHTPDRDWEDDSKLSKRGARRGLPRHRAPADRVPVRRRPRGRARRRARELPARRARSIPSTRRRRATVSTAAISRRSGRSGGPARPGSGTARSSKPSIRRRPTICSACSRPPTCSSRPTVRATPAASPRSRR